VVRVVGVEDVDVIAPLGPPGTIESVICPALALAAALSDSVRDCDFVQAGAMKSAAIERHIPESTPKILTGESA
jgi:hypothetical protein